MAEHKARWQSGLITIGLGLLGWACYIGVRSVDPDPIWGEGRSSAAQSAANLAALEAVPAIRRAEIVGRSQDILKRAPLDDAAFAQSALAHHLSVTIPAQGELAGLDEVSTALFLEAQRRNPRNRLAAQPLYVDAINSGRFDDAVKQIDLIYRIVHEQSNYRRELIWNLGGLHLSAQSRESVEQAIENGAVWSERFMEQAISRRRGAALADLAGVLRRYAKGASERSTKVTAERLVVALVDDGQFQQAGAIWHEYWPMEPDETSGSSGAVLNADPDLTQNTPFPFGWRVMASRFASAEFEPGGGLYMTMNGGPEVVLAEQYFLWPNGQVKTIELDVSATLNVEPQRSRFVAELVCLTLGPESESGDVRNASEDVVVGRLVLDETIADNTNLSQRFDVAGLTCEGGRLRLLGVPGQLSRSITGSVHSLTVTAIPFEGL